MTMNNITIEQSAVEAGQQSIEDAIKLVSYEARKNRYNTALDELEILESEVKNIRRWLEMKAIENDVNNKVSGKDNE